MLTLITATMLSMAAAKADPVAVARKNYGNCLIEAHNAAMKDKILVAAYKSAADERCPEQKKAFWDATVKSERAYSSQKDSEAYATDEVKIMVDSNDDAYENNFEKGSSLTPEP